MECEWYHCMQYFTKWLLPDIPDICPSSTVAVKKLVSVIVSTVNLYFKRRSDFFKRISSIFSAEISTLLDVDTEWMTFCANVSSAQ